MNEFLQLLANGLVTGSVIAIAAVGVSLVYGILRIVNFAHGDVPRLRRLRRRRRERHAGASECVVATLAAIVATARARARARVRALAADAPRAAPAS